MASQAGAWLLAAGSVVMAAAVAALPLEPAPVPDPPPSVDLTRLRVDLQRLGAENEALRRELDRLALRVAPAGTESPAPEPAGTPRPGPANDELARRAREAVLGAVGGDDRTWQEALDAVVDLVNEGTDVFPVLRDLYQATDDARTRRTLLPLLFYGGGGDEGLAFIASEMITFEDPSVRTNMLGTVAKVVNPRVAGIFKGAFLAGLEIDDSRARAASVYGLRLVDDPDVTEALFAAARDPSAPVRRLALEALVARGVDHERLRALLARDPSPHLREVGECALRVAAGG